MPLLLPSLEGYLVYFYHGMRTSSSGQALSCCAGS